MPEVSIQTEATPQEEARNAIFDEMASLDHDLATLLDYTNRLIHNHRRIRRSVLEKESLSSSLSPQSSSHPDDPEDPPSLEIPSLSTLNASPPVAIQSFPDLTRTRYSDLLADFTPLPPSSFVFSTNGTLIRLTSNDSLASPSSSSHSSSSTPSSPASIPVSSPLTSPSLSSKNHRYAPY